MVDHQILCIAGKNNIAVDVMKYVLEFYPSINVVACCNRTDTGKNGFQRSYRAFCELKGIQIVELNDLYQINNLIFLSLEYDTIIKPFKFKSRALYNIHFSFLPEYKGMFTSAFPILNGERYSGVTFHLIDAGIDTGDIIDQTKIYISKNLTAEGLYKLYIFHGTQLVLKCLNSVLNDNINSRPQSATKSSYYSKNSINYSNLDIDLCKTAFQIVCQINAYIFPAYQLPVILGTCVYKAQILKEKSLVKAGSIIQNERFFMDVSSIDYNVRIYKDLREDLYRSAELGDLDALKNFIENNYDIRQRSREGWDIAIISAYNGNLTYLMYLLDVLNWNIETANNNGTTLLMYVMTYASRKSDLIFLQTFLSKYNLNLKVQDYFGKDVFYYAEKYNNQDVINLLMSK